MEAGFPQMDQDYQDIDRKPAGVVRQEAPLGRWHSWFPHLKRRDDLWH